MKKTVFFLIAITTTVMLAGCNMSTSKTETVSTVTTWVVISSWDNYVTWNDVIDSWSVLISWSVSVATWENDIAAMQQDAIEKMWKSNNMRELLKAQCGTDPQPCSQDLSDQLYYQWRPLSGSKYEVAFTTKWASEKERTDIFQNSPEKYTVNFSNGNVERKRPIDGGLDLIMNLQIGKDVYYDFR